MSQQSQPSTNEPGDVAGYDVSAVTEILRDEGLVQPDEGAPDDTASGASEGDIPEWGTESGAVQGAADNALDGMEDATEENAQEDPDSDDEGESVTVAALAEKLDIEPAVLYDELQIPLSAKDGGGTITLGEFKDRIGDLKELDAARAAHDEDKASHEKGRMRDHSLLNEMLAMMGDDARPLYQAASARVESWENEQRDLLLEAIPEWREPDALAKDRQSIVALGDEYGFSEMEISSTQDARTVRMLRDYAKLREQHEAAKKAGKRNAVKPGRPGRPAKTSKGSRLAKALQKAQASPEIADKAQGVAAILQNAGIN